MEFRGVMLLFGGLWEGLTSHDFYHLNANQVSTSNIENMNSKFHLKGVLNTMIYTMRKKYICHIVNTKISIALVSLGTKRRLLKENHPMTYFLYYLSKQVYESVYH